MNGLGFTAVSGGFSKMVKYGRTWTFLALLFAFFVSVTSSIRGVQASEVPMCSLTSIDIEFNHDDLNTVLRFIRPADEKTCYTMHREAPPVTYDLEVYQNDKFLGAAPNECTQDFIPIFQRTYLYADEKGIQATLVGTRIYGGTKTTRALYVYRGELTCLID